MKKALTACFILMVCVCFFAVPALAPTAAFSRSAHPERFTSARNVQQQKDAEFTVDMKLTKSADIDILYSP